MKGVNLVSEVILCQEVIRFFQLHNQQQIKFLKFMASEMVLLVNPSKPHQRSY